MRLIFFYNTSFYILFSVIYYTRLHFIFERFCDCICFQLQLLVDEFIIFLKYKNYWQLLENVWKPYSVRACQRHIHFKLLFTVLSSKHTLRYLFSLCNIYNFKKKKPAFFVNKNSDIIVHKISLFLSFSIFSSSSSSLAQQLFESINCQHVFLPSVYIFSQVLPNRYSPSLL